MKNPGNQTPFRVGGRGSKQLSKALEQSSADRDLAWVFCTGSHACFAKVISFAMSGIMIQPMSPVEGDPNLYKPWEGHLWLEKRDQIHPVQVRGILGCYSRSHFYFSDETRIRRLESYIYCIAPRNG